MNGIAQIVGCLLMYGIGRNTSLSIAPWRVLFLICGAMTSAAEPGEGDGQVDGHRGLADAALAGADGDDVADARDRRAAALGSAAERTLAVISTATSVTPATPRTAATAWSRS